MALKVNKFKWVQYPEDDEIQFQIKPFSPLYVKQLPADEVKITQELIWDVFDSCVVGWKGIVDADDKPLPFNDANKRLVAEADYEILIFVFNKTFEKDKKKEEEAKN